jgi:uracil-DNA glycosylase
MTPDKLSRIKLKIERLRDKGDIKPIELERIARMVGRIPCARGREPTWVNMDRREWRPLSIPHHSKLNKNTARSILDMLEDDLDKLSEK